MRASFVKSTENTKEKRNMKQYLIALTMMLALHANASSVQPQHRHHAQVVAVDTTAQDGVEAYSDTTSTDLAGTEDSVYTYNTSSNSFDIDTGTEDFIKKLLGGTIGVGGVIIAVLVSLALLICVLAPFIIVILIIRYLINQHNNRISLAEKAMETGQPIPDDLKPVATESPEYYRRKGIKNTAIGVGLAIMFAIWGSDMLAGIGVLIACWGIGQLVIAKTSK